MLPAMMANRMANNGRLSGAPSLRSHPVNCETDNRCSDSVAIRHPPVQEVTSEDIAANMLCHYHNIRKDEKQVLRFFGSIDHDIMMCYILSYCHRTSRFIIYT